MVDSKIEVSQVQKLKVILHDIYIKGMMINETFQVAVVIEKLPLAWKDSKNYLKYKRNEMSIEDLIIKLHIKEENQGYEKKGAQNLSEAKANFVEHGQSSKFKKANNKGKCTKLGPIGGVSKKQKFQGKCFNYGKEGYKSTNCIPSKRNKPKKANVVDNITKDVFDIDLKIVIYEVNLMGSNSKELWIDIGVTSHVCSDKKTFSIFDPIETWDKVFIGNLATFGIVRTPVDVTIHLFKNKEFSSRILQSNR